MKRISIGIGLFLMFLVSVSCNRYRQNILFQVDETSTYDTLVSKAEDLQKNYIIKANDLLSVSIYTSNGEVLIDPEKMYNISGGGGPGSTSTTSDISYLVDAVGFVNLPMVGKIKIDSLTLPQADSLLAIKYAEYYEKCFVITKCMNRRVTLISGSKGMIIPIENENTTLIEVIALAGGVNNLEKAHNIKLVRGEGQNMKMSVIDLTKVEGIKLANTKIENHDIIYIEPVRKVVSEAITDVMPIVSVALSLLAFIVVISNRR